MDILEVKSIGIIIFSSVLSLVRVHQSRSKSAKILKSVDGDANPSSKQTKKQQLLAVVRWKSSEYDNGDYGSPCFMPIFIMVRMDTPVLHLF